MDSVPAEVQRRILRSLDPSGMLSAALACRRWFCMLRPHLPALRHLHISLDGTACDATKIDFRSASDTSAALCQCSAHARVQAELVRALLAQFGAGLCSVHIEDNLLNRCSEECIRDYPFHMILSECSGHNLRHLSLHCVDLSSVRVWTLSTMAKYSALTSVSFEECKFPAELNESLLLRMLAPSFGAIQVLRITDNPMITDKLGTAVAKRCARLEELSLRGCGQVTAVTAVAFCENLAKSYGQGGEGQEGGGGRPLPVTLHLRDTAFDTDELSRHLHSPWLHCDQSSWSIQPIRVDLGFQRRALLLAEQGRIDGLGMVLFLD